MRRLEQLRAWNNVRCSSSGLAFLHTEMRWRDALVSAWMLARERYIAKEEKKGGRLSFRTQTWQEQSALLDNRDKELPPIPPAAQSVTAGPKSVLISSSLSPSCKWLIISLRVFERKQFGFFFSLIGCRRCIRVQDSAGQFW